MSKAGIDNWKRDHSSRWWLRWHKDGAYELRLPKDCTESLAENFAREYSELHGVPVTLESKPEFEAP